MKEFRSNNDRGYWLKLWLDPYPPNIQSNSTQVRVRLFLVNGNTTFSQYNCTARVSINGQNLDWSGRPEVLNFNSTTPLIDKMVTINHNADGTKRFNFSANFNGSGGWSPRNLNIGNTGFNLSTIPRGSSLEISQGYIGSSIPFKIKRASGNFKHTLRYQWYDRFGTIGTNLDTDGTWYVPMDFADKIPIQTQSTCDIYLDTFNGNTKIATQKTTILLKLNGNVVPTFDGFTLSEINQRVANKLSGRYLQVLSNISATFKNAQGSHGSKVTNFYAEIVGKNLSISSERESFGSMNFHGNIEIKGYVTDSRGRKSATKSIKAKVLPYHAPIFNFAATRARDNPKKIVVTRNAKVAPLSENGNDNKLEFSFKVAKVGENKYISDFGDASKTFTSISELINSQAMLSGDYDETKSWTILGKVSDYFMSTEFTVNISTDKVVMSYDQFGVGIGKIRENGALDVAGDIYANGKPIQQHMLSQDTGQAIELKPNQNWNDVKMTGFYMGANNANQPKFNEMHDWKYVRVTRHLDTYVLQECIDFNGVVSCYRVCINGGWRPWTRLATVNDLPSPRNSDWVYIGNGFEYKRFGDIVGLRYNFSANKIERLSVGSVPPDFTSREMIFTVGAWMIETERLINIQVNENGLIEWINPKKYDETYKGQVTWLI